jgi:LPXTG-motif cell wall-anchored protein
MLTRRAAATVLTLGWGLNTATAGMPDLPPYTPPPPVTKLPPPPITNPPPPIHDPPPPKHNSPEPASIVLGAIGVGIGGLITRRRRKG